MNEAILTLRDLEVGYGGRPLLPPIQLELRTGDVWALVGPNGSGKTTLLRSILGLLPRVGGQLDWGGRAPAVGYVPQRTSLDGSMPARVIDVVRGGIDTGWTFAHPAYLWRKRAQVDSAMEDTSVTQLRGQQFSTLSEGQKQRVLVARALASSPRVLVLDEPTSAMDIDSERRTMELIDDLRTRRRLAVVLVSHHLPVVAAHATHLLLVDKDRRFVLGGPTGEVGADPECVSRYGRLFQNASGAEASA